MAERKKPIRRLAERALLNALPLVLDRASTLIGQSGTRNIFIPRGTSIEIDLNRVIVAVLTAAAAEIRRKSSEKSKKNSTKYE